MYLRKVVDIFKNKNGENSLDDVNENDLNGIANRVATETFKLLNKPTPI